MTCDTKTLGQSCSGKLRENVEPDKVDMAELLEMVEKESRSTLGPPFLNMTKCMVTADSPRSGTIREHDFLERKKTYLCKS